MKGQVKVIAVGKERKGPETYVDLVSTNIWGMVVGMGKGEEGGPLDSVFG